MTYFADAKWYASQEHGNRSRFLVPYTAAYGGNIPLITDAAFGDLLMKVKAEPVTQAQVQLLARTRRIRQMTVIRSEDGYGMFFRTASDINMELYTFRGTARTWKNLAKLVKWIDETLPSVRHFEVLLQEQMNANTTEGDSKD